LSLRYPSIVPDEIIQFAELEMLCSNYFGVRGLTSYNNVENA